MAFKTLAEESRLAKSFGVSGEHRQVGIPTLGKRLRLHSLEAVGKIGVLAAVGSGQLGPGLVQMAAAAADALAEMLAHAVRHQKFGVLGPAVIAFGEADLLLAERLAMGRAGVLLVRRPITDMAFDDDQGRHVASTPEAFEGLRQPRAVIGIADVLHIPAISEETRRHILAEGQIGVALDRYPVAVVDPAQIAEHLVTGERSRLA